MSDDGSGSGKNSQRTGALITAGAVVLAALITGVFTLLPHEGGNSTGGQATSSLPVGTPSQSPVPPGTPGRARIEHVTSYGTCIGDTVKVAIVISSPASADRELWLMSVVMTGTPTHPVYYAKQQLFNAPGQHVYTVQFVGAAIGSVRNLAVVSSAPASFSWLKRNQTNDGNPAWDTKRLKLPNDVPEISSNYKVTRQC
jgi:hypothetical protein